MRKESIIVVYDSCQATAEEIADKLGAEPVSVQALNHRMVESARNFVLCVTLEGNGQLPVLWLYGWQTLLGNDIHGKGVAVLILNGNHSNWVVDSFCEDMRKSGAHMIGDVFFADSDQERMDCWIASISPNI